MRVATWNVNSAKVREPRLLPWLDQRSPDAVCLQETKLSDAEFAGQFDAALAKRGYEVVHYGQGRWNGVALLSRVGLEDVVRGLPGAPRYPDELAEPEARAVTATCGGLRVTSVYVPNGRTPDDPHYQYKLRWLATLREMVATGDIANSLVCGDMNIAPTDADVYDPEAYIGSTHVTPLEREALAALTALGMVDVVRRRWPESERVFTYWDYRAGMFHQDLGMRIDLVLAGRAVADRVAAAWVDRQARKGSGPSDHAPVIVDLDQAPDGDIGPVVPPASAPAHRRKVRRPV
jgi:exodeoxyribonuclease-3